MNFGRGRHSPRLLQQELSEIGKTELHSRKIECKFGSPKGPIPNERESTTNFVEFVKSLRDMPYYLEDPKPPPEIEKYSDRFKPPPVKKIPLSQSPLCVDFLPEELRSIKIPGKAKKEVGIEVDLQELEKMAEIEAVNTLETQAKLEEEENEEISEPSDEDNDEEENDYVEDYYADDRDSVGAESNDNEGDYF